MSLTPAQKRAFAKINAAKKELKSKHPDLTDKPGIYMLVRTDGPFKYAYIGQAKKLWSRLAQHMLGYQDIDLSIRKHKLDENADSWFLSYVLCDLDKLDELEQYFISEYAQQGYQLKNRTSGSQSAGKLALDNQTRAPRKYHDGLIQGKVNVSRDLDDWFTKHLVVSTKSCPPTVNQQKALDKFNQLLKFHEEVKAQHELETDCK